MDEMRVVSKFMCGIFSKILQMAIKKCCGTKTKINLANVSYTYEEGGKVNVHVKDLDIAMSSKEFEKLILGKLDKGEEE